MCVAEIRQEFRLISFEKMTFEFLSSSFLPSSLVDQKLKGVKHGGNNSWIITKSSNKLVCLPLLNFFGKVKKIASKAGIPSHLYLAWQQYSIPDSLYFMQLGFTMKLAHLSPVQY